MTPVEDEASDTLDLTKIKMTLGQMLVLVALITGLISTSTISLYQLSEVRKAQDTAVVVQLDMVKRIAALESDKAARDAFERGLKAAEQAKKEATK